MPMQAQTIIDEIEEIKARLNSIESVLIASEEADNEDKEAVKESLEEYRKGKTIKFKV